MDLNITTPWCLPSYFFNSSIRCTVGEVFHTMLGTSWIACWRWPGIVAAGTMLGPHRPHEGAMRKRMLLLVLHTRVHSHSLENVVLSVLFLLLFIYFVLFSFICVWIYALFFLFILLNYITVILCYFNGHCDVSRHVDHNGEIQKKVHYLHYMLYFRL